MQSDGPENQEKTSITEVSTQDRTADALSILKELKKIQEKSEKAGFNFLSYLVHMAILEAQSVASGEKGSGAETKQTGTSS